MADAAQVLEFPTKGTLDRAYTGRLRRCVKCGEDKPHTTENFRACDEVRNGQPYRYVKKLCRICEHIARVNYSRSRAKAGNAFKKLSPDRLKKHREWNLRRLYGLTQAQFDILLEVQGGKCAVCGGDQNDHHASGRQQRMTVDHCHKTTKVRGLLCGSCNRGLGDFKDDPERLRKAAAYLERTKW